MASSVSIREHIVGYSAGLQHSSAMLFCCQQGREKIGLVLTFTDMGFDIVVSDVDTVWLKNPIPYLAQYPEADILVSSDSLVGCFGL